MLDKKAKQKIIEKFKTHETDTGSSDVQIAILTFEIKDLIEHLRQHRKDQSSRRGLLRKVAERRQLLKYLQKENQISYESLVKKLKLKAARALSRSDAKREEEELEAEIKEAEVAAL